VGIGGDLQKIPMDPLCLLEQIVSSMPNQEIRIVRCHIICASESFSKMHPGQTGRLSYATTYPIRAEPQPSLII
jgi:hypothetical protein